MTPLSDDFVPEFRPSLVVIAGEGQTAHFVETRLRKVSTYTVTDQFAKIVEMIDGRRTIDEICRDMAPRGASRQEVTEIIASLDAANYLVDVELWNRMVGDAAAPEFDRRERFFYELFADGAVREEIDGTVTNYPARLRSATVAVVGVGGTGSWAVRSLAGYGVGHLVLIDPDTVDIANLPHQVMFNRASVGLPKVSVCADELQATFGDINVTTHCEPLTPDSMELLDGADAVLVTADRPSPNVLARLVNEWALANNVIASLGAAYAHDMATFGLSIIPGRTPCWLCYETELADTVLSSLPSDPVRLADGNGGTVPVLPSVLGSVAAWDVVRMLIGLPPLLSGRAVNFDAHRLSLDEVEVTTDPNCRCQSSRVPSHA